MRANPIRFTGMASGMDTDSIVKDLLRPQQYKIDNQKKAQALLQLKQDAWKDMNKKLFDFHTKFTQKMSMASTYNKTITSMSNESVLSIGKDVVVPPGTHKFDVTQLAEPAMVMGVLEEKVRGNTSVSEFLGLGDNPTDDKIVMNINDKEIIIQLKNEIDADGKVTKTADTLNSMVGKLNDALKDQGFTSRLDEQNGLFTISSTKTGKDQEIGIKVDSNGSALFEKLGLGDNLIANGDTTILKIANGKDAIYSYNDVSGFTSSTNQIEINGIKATLKSTGATNISSTKDPDAIYDFVKEFVTEYNKLIDEINEKIGTKPGKGIEPLTAEERKSMSESEIKIWEDKLNSSLFYKDPHLTEFVDSARAILGKVLKIDGKDTSLASFGIVTGTWEERGKLYIEGDEDSGLHSSKENKLRKAIEEDPDQVAKFFEALGKELYDTHKATFNRSNDLKSALNFYNDKVINKEISNYDKEIATLEERMYRLEQIHYAKFAAMEKMLSSLNSQSSWLAQQFGGN